MKACQEDAVDRRARISGRISHEIAFKGETGFWLIESLLRLRPDVFGSVLAHMALPATALALPLAVIVARVLNVFVGLSSADTGLPTCCPCGHARVSGRASAV